MRIFQTALDLADAREGALFVVARDTNAVAKIVSPVDRLDVPHPAAGRQGPPSRRDLLDLLEGRSLTDLDPNVLAALASLDGAIVVDRNARLLAAGAILRHPQSDEPEAGVVEGARTTAALAASKFGPVLKVSEDGIITFFDGEKVWDI
jgi:DNA integrity scanning protein DisA with diadenylate cyclase activity